MLCLKTKTKKFAVLTFHFDFELLLVWVFEPGFHKTVFEDPEMTLPLTVWLFWLGVGVWVLGDGPFIERQWYGVTDVTHIWTTLWGQRLFCFFFFYVTFSFSSHSDVLCFEPQLNPAGRDPVSAIPYLEDHDEVLTWSRVFEGPPIFTYVCPCCVACPSAPGPPGCRWCGQLCAKLGWDVREQRGWESFVRGQAYLEIPSCWSPFRVLQPGDGGCGVPAGH